MLVGHLAREVVLRRGGLEKVCRELSAFNITSLPRPTLTGPVQHMRDFSTVVFHG